DRREREAQATARDRARRGRATRFQGTARALRKNQSRSANVQIREAARAARAAVGEIQRSRGPRRHQPPEARGVLPVRLIVAALLALGVCTVGAQTFPSKPLRVIVPQPPGGGFDLVARTLSEPLAALLGQPVVVENRPGGGTVVGTDVVAKAEPDGHTILLGASANL